MRARTHPRVGGSVAVLHLGATAAGVVEQIDEGGRRLVVRTEDGSTLTFVLNRATGSFTHEGRQWEARLLFDDRDEVAALGITTAGGGG